jgi:hypothetical protein
VSDHDQSRLASSSINTIYSKGMKVVLPDICVGEVMRVVAQKKLEVDFECLRREIVKEKIVVGHVADEDLRHYSNLIREIRKADKVPESCDVRILAFSLGDRNCQGLLTFDRGLIESVGLRRYAVKHAGAKRKYVITENPFGE